MRGPARAKPVITRGGPGLLARRGPLSSRSFTRLPLVGELAPAPLKLAEIRGIPIPSFRSSLSQHAPLHSTFLADAIHGACDEGGFGSGLGLVHW